MALLCLGGASHAAAPFSADTVEALARSLAERDYAPVEEVKGPTAALSYDQYRDIRFRPDKALWRAEKLPFQVQLFHLGSFYRAPVEISVVEQGRAQPLSFATELFEYGPHVPPLGSSPPSQFAGFRLHHPLNRTDYFDELVVFLGASYFRALAKDTGYGISARGLSVDTAQPRGEEFPSFRRFWLEKPARDARELTVHALLDSPSVTGAYRFVIRPGEVTRMDVNAVVFPRAAVDKLGLAPLTSMYLHGENDRGSAEDFRPEVHDSDGLLIWNGTGERLWRPLSNPARLRVSSFQVQGVKGFGLLQRDRAFSSYEDLEARYERRPGVWVEARSGFDQGAVTLVEIPTPEEIHDNVVVFFTPAKPVERGEQLRFAYRLLWGKQPAPPVTTSGVVATRSFSGTQPGRRRFLVDFSAPSSPHAASNLPLVPMVSTSRGSVVDARAQPHPISGGARVVFELESDGSDPVELRCFLKQGEHTLSETWTDQWNP